jgi:hypothetical protein
MGKAQRSAHSWWLHELRVEARRQVACVEAVAGTVGMQRWRSALACGRNDAQACAEEICRVGRPSLNRRGLRPVSKWNWTALSSGPGPVNLFQYSKYFPIAFN